MPSKIKQASPATKQNWIGNYASKTRAKTLFSKYNRVLAGSRIDSIPTELKNSAKVTLRIKRRAMQMLGNDAKKLSPEDTFSLLLKRFTEGIKFTDEDHNKMNFLYGKLSADEIISTGKIPASFYKGVPINGCGNAADALLALMKSIPVFNNVKHIRTINYLGFPHSLVYFETSARTPQGAQYTKRFLVDPFQAILNRMNGVRSSVVEQIGETLTERINTLKQNGLWHEGESLVDFNKNHADYLVERNIFRQKMDLPQIKQLILTRKGLL